MSEVGSWSEGATVTNYIADKKSAIVTSVEATPVCGESFCDDCGNCLACDGNDPCVYRTDGHRWVEYPEN